MKNIDKIENISLLRKTLKNRPRDLLLFDMATQTGLQFSQLLPFKVADIINLKIGDDLSVKPARGSNLNSIEITSQLYESIQYYLREVKPSENDFLFMSRKGKGCLTKSSATNLVKSWFKAAGIEVAGGALALRKIWKLHFRDNSLRFQLNRIHNIDSVKNLEPIEQVNTIQEIVYDKLCKAFVTGIIPPGEKLYIEKVARQFKVSRMPVREAFQRLRTAGFIVTKNKENFVSRLSKSDLNEISEMRCMLEPRLGELAATKCHKETLLFLKQIHQDIINAVKIGNHYDVLSKNRKFHFTIYRAANRPLMVDMVKRLWDKTSPYFFLIFKSKEIDPIIQHHNILDNIKRCNPIKVSHWLRVDIEEGIKIINEFEF